MIGVTVPQEVQVDVLKRVRSSVLDVAEDCSRVWKSAGRRIDGWTRFEAWQAELVEKDRGTDDVIWGLS